MIRHLLFYCAEATFITVLVCAGVFLAVNALRRSGVSIQPRWLLTFAGLWIPIACIDAVMSESIGPEFTLLYYFGIWSFVGGLVLWLVIGIRQGSAALKRRFAKERKNG